MDVTDLASPIEITVDLLRRNISFAMKLQAPMNKKTSRARVRWLLRQISGECPDGIYISADWPGRAGDIKKPMAEVIDNPDILRPKNKRMVPKAFEISMVQDLAGRFSGSRKFVQKTEYYLLDFYDRVGENLRAWVPPPPKLRDEEEEVEPKANRKNHVLG